VVQEWARDQESALARGSWVDPAAGRVTVKDWHARWEAARVVSTSTTARNESHWRNHVQPEWGAWPLANITGLDVGAWVKRMIRARVGPPTVHACVNLLSAMLQAATDEGVIPRNPCKGTSLPAITVRAPEWFSRAEHAALLAKLEEPYRTLVDLACTVGPRWGELTGLHGDDVDWLREQLSIWRVSTRTGMREHPKSSRSRRVVPLPPHILEGMSRLMVGRPRGAPLFAAPGGGRLNESNFRTRVWGPALVAAKLPYRRPHVMRHTAATWLVQAGVDLYRVQALLGHEDFRTTQRYAHHAPDAHAAIRAAWAAHLAPTLHDEKEPHQP
jgi:integrase